MVRSSSPAEKMQWVEYGIYDPVGQSWSSKDTAETSFVLSGHRCLVTRLLLAPEMGPCESGIYGEYEYGRQHRLIQTVYQTYDITIHPLPRLPLYPLMGGLRLSKGDRGL